MPCPTLPGSSPPLWQLSAILKKALQKNPAHRYAQTGEFATQVKDLLACFATPVSLDVKSPVFRALRAPSPAPAVVSWLDKGFDGAVDLEFRSSRVRKIAGLLDRMEYFSVLNPWLSTTVLASLVLGRTSFNMNVALAVFGVNFAVMGAGYLLFGTPKLVLIPVGIVEFWSTIPRCRNCARQMRIVNRIVRFAVSPVEVEFALLDCISALEENLWEDAVKLFSLHTHEFAPTVTNTLVDAPLRYELGICHCSFCGQRCIQLSTDRKDGERWAPQPDYVRAHKASPLEDEPPSLFRRSVLFMQTVGQAVNVGFLRTSFVHVLLIGVLVFSLFFVAGWLLL